MARICHFSSAHRAGDIRIVRKEARAAAAAGHEVSVVIQGDMPADCAAVRHVPLSPPPGGRLGRFTLLGWRTWRAALHQGADIYHFHDPDLLPYALLMRAAGRRVIYDAHEDVPRDILSKEWIPVRARRVIARVFEVFEDFAAKRMSAVVTATPFIGERFRRLNPQTTTVNNYPMMDELAPPPEGPDGERRGFCYVGGISAIRSAREMVEACALAGQPLVVAGPMETQALAASLQALPGWKHVDYRGQLSRADVAAVLARSIAGLVLFHPEPNHVNSQPNKLFEYMSAGLPVIASDFPMWKDIVERYDCGVCVDPCDPRAIAAAMSALAADPERARRMGANGRRAVLEKFNWEREQHVLLDVYQRCRS
ncbi:glycosyltransferase [Ramlibacter pallidus]|uniref:Glycosyltransferase n=1 Tax=Ramlibacter pallidus TaxID=2780087 RepID=A0ABR9RYE8_9BURK|nr:glycosyltransferase [Ramlibacter pallidus]MBE7366263.1 glycosyltransferase [Ramlibacter pallidus]